MDTSGSWSWFTRRKLLFEVYTSISMVEPSEKAAIYGILLILMLMLLYTTIVYLPTHVSHLLAVFI